MDPAAEPVRKALCEVVGRTRRGASGSYTPCPAELYLAAPPATPGRAAQPPRARTRLCTHRSSTDARLPKARSTTCGGRSDARRDDEIRGVDGRSPSGEMEGVAHVRRPVPRCRPRSRSLYAGRFQNARLSQALRLVHMRRGFSVGRLIRAVRWCHRWVLTTMATLRRKSPQVVAGPLAPA